MRFNQARHRSGGAGDIKIHELKLNDINLDQFHNSIVSSEKDIFRSFGIALVFAFQDEQNRSTAQFSSNLMRVTKLTKIRTRLKNVLEPQWYERNLRALMKKRDKEANQLQAEEGLEQYQDTGVVNALERSTKILKIDPNALPFRPRMKFVDKKVDTFLEISEAALGWYQANILSKEEAAELGQLDQYVEKIAAREAEQKLLAPTTPAPISEPAVTGPQKITDLTPNFGGAQGGSVIKSLEEETMISRAKLAKELLLSLTELNNTK